MKVYIVILRFLATNEEEILGVFKRLAEAEDFADKESIKHSPTWATCYVDRWKVQ